MRRFRLRSLPLCHSTKTVFTTVLTNDSANAATTARLVPNTTRVVTFFTRPFSCSLCTVAYVRPLGSTFFGRPGRPVRAGVFGSHYFSCLPMKDHFSLLSKAHLLQTLVSDFVEETLDGSLSPFVTYLTQQATLTQAQRNELKRLVEELGAQRKEAES